MRIIIFVLSFVMLIEAFSGIYDFDLSVSARAMNLLYYFTPWLLLIILTSNGRIRQKTLGFIYLGYSIGGYFYFLYVANFSGSEIMIIAILTPVLLSGILFLLK